MKLTLNIGAEDLPYKGFTDSETVTRLTFDVLYALGFNQEFEEIVNHRVEIGEWEGKPEKTFILQVQLTNYAEYKNSVVFEWVQEKIEELCKMVNQDAIAFLLEGDVTYGYLSYRSNYPEDKRISFDIRYFINL